MEKLPHISRREKRETMTEALKEYVNPLIADMYQTALNLFPARTLEEMRIVIKEEAAISGVAKASRMAKKFR